MSVGIRYADGRVKSLLNLTRKSIDTRGPASPFARTLGTSPQLEDFEPGLGTSSAQTLPPPLLSDGGSSFRSKPERSETLPRFPSAMGSPAALDSQLLVGCSKRLLTIVSAAVLDSSSNAARGSFEERRLSFAQDLEPARPSTRTTARGRSTASGTSLDAASALTSPLPSRPLFSTVPESAPVAPADGVLQDLLFGGPSTSGPDEEGQPELQPACWHEVYITCTRTPSERCDPLFCQFCDGPPVWLCRPNPQQSNAIFRVFESHVAKLSTIAHQGPVLNNTAPRRQPLGCCSQR